jgi:hypothetical protein
MAEQFPRLSNSECSLLRGMSLAQRATEFSNFFWPGDGKQFSDWPKSWDEVVGGKADQPEKAIHYVTADA